MLSLWNEAIISKICMAVYVAPGHGRHIHKNRDFHGFVLNESCCKRDYIFSDGTVLSTTGGSLFYLPEGSSYYVKTLEPGGCYCINFKSDVCDGPFVVNLRSFDGILHNFKAASNAWLRNDELKHSSSMRALYDAIYQMQKEHGRNYLSNSNVAVIGPAIERIERCFTDGELTVEELAEDCKISTVYLRKIFMSKFGLSPKSYLIKKRIEYAKRLLASKGFTISEVAIQCGYTEPCHFSREFSKHVGTSPSKYCEMQR